MPQFRVNVKVETKGAIFNASKTQAAGRRLIVDINEAIAQEGVNRVLARLQRVLKNPSGYYQSQIAVQKRQIYRGYWDNNAIYGGWLEGVSSRNRTTRFKGYRTFRMVKQTLDRDAVSIAKPLVDKYIREMNS